MIGHWMPCSVLSTPFFRN